jgi:hypothetical protein
MIELILIVIAFIVGFFVGVESLAWHMNKTLLSKADITNAIAKLE